MLGKSSAVFAIAAYLSLSCEWAVAQHLWWDESYNHKDATCVYGEITVLATHFPIYYCGANWHPGEPAGGYCGIQPNGPKERRTIFSVWDTSASLHPRVSRADQRTVFHRFGGEGEGAHTHMLWDWQVGSTFQFFVRKTTGARPNTTDVSYYIFDHQTKNWVHSATITSPNGDKKSEKSVATIGGGGLASFLENFGGTDKEIPKLALYRLWLGTKPDQMKCLTHAVGDSTWGQFNDCYFLAEGDDNQLKALFGRLKEKYGLPVFGEKGKKLEPISDKPLSRDLVKQLMPPPKAPEVRPK